MYEVVVPSLRTKLLIPLQNTFKIMFSVRYMQVKLMFGVRAKLSVRHSVRYVSVRYIEVIL